MKRHSTSSHILGGTQLRSWASATKDLTAGAQAWKVWSALGWLDVRQRYRRSIIGPFWLTISTAFSIGSIGFLYSYLLKIPLSEFMPYLTVGLLLWNFISAMVIDGCYSLIHAEGFIKQTTLPKSIFTFRAVWRNIILFAHNIVIFLFVVLIYPVSLGWNSLLALGGLLLLLINGLCATLILGMACLRFRDIPQIVINVMQVLFFISPILWKKEGMGEMVHRFVVFNPFSYMLEIVRGPLLGNPFDEKVWLVAGSLTVVHLLLTFLLFPRYRARIAYWL